MIFFLLLLSYKYLTWETIRPILKAPPSIPPISNWNEILSDLISLSLQLALDFSRSPSRFPALFLFIYSFFPPFSFSSLFSTRAWYGKSRKGIIYLSNVTTMEKRHGKRDGGCRSAPSVVHKINNNNNNNNKTETAIPDCNDHSKKKKKDIVITANLTQELGW